MSSPPTLPSIEFPPGWNFELDLIVLFGHDLDGIAQAFREHGQKRILLYDSEARTSGQSSERVHTPVELVEAIQVLPGADPGRIVVVPAPPAHIPEDLAPILRQVTSDALASRATHRATLERSGLIFVRQALANLPELAKLATVDVLRGAFPSRPCVIVSPGPSLEKNLRTLSTIGDRALICTSTHALPALESAGVRPHFVLAIDPLPLDWQYGEYDFRQVPALVLAAMAHPDLYQLPAARILTCSNSPAVESWVHEGLPGDPCLPAGGSVAGAELSLALAMGCNPILFVGQDLAMTGGRYYSESVLDGDSRVNLGEDGQSYVLERHMKYPGALSDRADENGVAVNRREALIQVQGWHGGVVPTSASFYHFRAWIAARCHSVEGDRRIYNCTEGGAWIDGTRHEPLLSVLERELGEGIPIESELDARLRRWDPCAAQDTLGQRATGQLAALGKVTQLAESCDRLARRAGRDRRALDELGHKEKELSASLRGLQFLSLSLQKEIRSTTERAARSKSLATNLSASRRLFQVIQKVATELHKPLERAATCLRTPAD